METLSITINNREFEVLCLPGLPKALLDKTVAEIYEISVKRVNETVKRNPKKFPEDFYFELTLEEARGLGEIEDPNSSRGKSPSAISSSRDIETTYNNEEGGVSKGGTGWKKGHLPKAFTPPGCNMLASILKAPRALHRSVQIVLAFATLKERKKSREEDSLPPQSPYEQLLREWKKTLKEELSQTLQSTQEEMYYPSPMVGKFKALEEKFRFFEREIDYLREGLMEIKRSESSHLVIPALTEEVYRNRQELQRLQGEMDKLQGNLKQMELPFFDGNGNGNGKITQDQLRKLKGMAAQKAFSRKEMMSLWADFKRVFGISRYIHLPQNRFEAALDWLKNK